jgi:hypothetical protein
VGVEGLLKSGQTAAAAVHTAVCCFLRQPKPPAAGCMWRAECDTCTGTAKDPSLNPASHPLLQERLRAMHAERQCVLLQAAGLTRIGRGRSPDQLHQVAQRTKDSPRVPATQTSHARSSYVSRQSRQHGCGACMHSTQHLKAAGACTKKTTAGLLLLTAVHTQYVIHRHHTPTGGTTRLACRSMSPVAQQCWGVGG